MFNASSTQSALASCEVALSDKRLRMRRRATWIAPLLVVMLLAAGCESGYLTYENTRIGVRLGHDGGLEVLSFGCVNAPVTRVWVSRKDVDEEVWSATALEPMTGLVVLPADGSMMRGWEVVGGVEMQEKDVFGVHASLDGDDSQHYNGFQSHDLDNDTIFVQAQAFEGGRHVSLSEFVARNEDLCVRVSTP